MGDNTQITSTSSRKATTVSHKLIAFCVGLLVLAALAVGAAIITGYLFVGFKTPDQVFEPQYRVCGRYMVEEFNNTALPLDDNGKQKLVSMKDTIANTAHSDQDPTCQTLRFYIGYHTDDVAAMETSLQSVEALNRDVQFADSRLKTSVSTDTMRTMLDFVKNEDN